MSHHNPKNKHCKLSMAVNCAVGIECSHGRDVCPECDPCTCPPPPPRFNVLAPGKRVIQL